MNTAGLPEWRVHREIKQALSQSDAWPDALSPADAAAVRQFVTTALDGVLGVIDELRAGEAAGWTYDPVYLKEVVRTLESIWDQDAGALVDAQGWRRVVAWLALGLAYLDRAADNRWPSTLRTWLSDTNNALLGWLTPALAREVEAMTERRGAPGGNRPLPTLATPASLDVPAVAAAEAPLRSITARPRFRGGGDEPEAAVAPEPEAADDGPRMYDVWYGTNRKPGDLANPKRAFGNERDPAGTVHYGSCTVEIPKTHKFGSIGTAWWKRWARFEFRDDHLRLVEVMPFADGDEFFGEMQAQMAELAPAERHALVYIHGFNVSFEEAAIRAAQIGFDLKVPGATAFFSWPSADDTGAYFADQDRIEASEEEIAAFISRMARESGAETVHILAHSMGNRGLARAIQGIAKRAAQEHVRFGHIILAAPDVSVDLFRTLAAVYPTLSRRTTMYASAKDRALALSSWLQDSARAGFTPPITVVEGIDTIEVTDIDLTVLGHGYYAAAEAVLYDMSQLLHSDLDPTKRPRLRAVRGTNGDYWKIGA